ncbi:MAG: methyltransferase domain-containing protein, partial [Pirellulales bacterium]|nr:methyltransferase domain-containing protein [Pirellulales bacterium]
MKMLNIGCGACRHADWVNLDLNPNSPDVIALDATKGLPFESNTVDVCYSSHVLEHLSREEATSFIGEQRRVLKKGGVIRVVVPDLEGICRLYLAYLDDLVNGNEAQEFRYDYTLLELFDQTTRDAPGGELRAAWQSLRPEHRDYVLSRHGKEAETVLSRIEGHANAAANQASTAALLSRRRLRKLLKKSRAAAAAAAVRLLMGQQGLRSFRQGVFRNSGEIHRVMYDRFRLPRLLASHGFVD